MEKISFQATYTKISIYASASSGARKTVDKAGTGETPDPAVGDGGEGGHGSAGKGTAGACQRNKDGDTFTLSIEARSIRISGTLIVDDSGKPPSEKGTDAEATGAEYLESLGLPADVRLVNAFLDAMRKSKAEDRDGSPGRQHHFPQLADPQDVADRLIGQLGREHAEKGGSRTELAEGVRRRLSDWEPSASKVAVEYREFRSEVRMKLTSGLDAWVASDAGPAEGKATA